MYADQIDLFETMKYIIAIYIYCKDFFSYFLYEHDDMSDSIHMT